WDPASLAGWHTGFVHRVAILVQPGIRSFDLAVRRAVRGSACRTPGPLTWSRPAPGRHVGRDVGGGQRQ
ncbi:hypothetical protein, partial [Streptomyces sp. NPDC002587]